MEGNLKKYKIAIFFSLFWFGLASASILILLLFDMLNMKQQELLTNITVVIFWFGIILGIIFVRITTSISESLRKWIRKNEPKKNIKRKSIPGILTFRKKHMLLYAIIIIGIAVSMMNITGVEISKIIMYPIISVTFFAIILHSVIDGENYNIYKKMKEGMEIVNEQ